MRKRRAALLLDTLIALGLFSIMLALLFSSIFQLGRQGRSLQTLERSLEPGQTLQTILEEVFSRHVREPWPEGGKSGVFFFTLNGDPAVARGDTLVFLFDNLLDSMDAYSSTQLAQLYINADRQLCLTYWPFRRNDRKMGRTEILKEGVDTLSFSFFWPRQNSQDRDATIQPKTGWNGAWLQEYEKIPPLLHLRISTLRGEQVHCAFALPESNCPLSFRPETTSKLEVDL